MHGAFEVWSGLHGSGSDSGVNKREADGQWAERLSRCIEYYQFRTGSRRVAREAERQGRM